MTTDAPRRALRTTDAAKYLGISPSLLRKMRMRGADDPLGPGPSFIKLSCNLVVYEISLLDQWLEGHRQSAVARRQAAGEGIS
jgi:hypothetical protein